MEECRGRERKEEKGEGSKKVRNGVDPRLLFRQVFNVIHSSTDKRQFQHSTRISRTALQAEINTVLCTPLLHVYLRYLNLAENERPRTSGGRSTAPNLP